jgi:hypothetical protein
VLVVRERIDLRLSKALLKSIIGKAIEQGKEGGSGRGGKLRRQLFFFFLAAVFFSFALTILLSRRC